MKFLILALLATLPAAAMANECPANTELQLKCKSTPKKGDNEFAAEMFDSINVCRGTETAALIVTKDKKSETVKVDYIEDRMGGTTYRIVAEDVDFTFSAPVVFAKEFPATFGVEFNDAGLKGSSTYTCAR